MVDMDKLSAGEALEQLMSPYLTAASLLLAQSWTMLGMFAPLLRPQPIGHRELTAYLESNKELSTSTLAHGLLAEYSITRKEAV